MKICPLCHFHETDDTSLFCSECGYRFPASPSGTGKNMLYSPASLEGDRAEETSPPINPSGQAAGRPEAPAGTGTGRGMDKSCRPADDYYRGRDPHGYPVDNGGISFASNLDADRPGRPVWPFIAGFIALAIIAGISAWFFISSRRLEKKQQAEIDQHYSDIEAIYNRQKDHYLEDALKDWKGDDFLDQAKDIKNDENLENEQVISGLKSTKEEFQTYDDTLAKKQEEELDKSFDGAKGQYNEEFLIEGEQDRLDQYETDYADHKGDRYYKEAKEDIEGYSDLEKNIMNDDEDSSNYSTRAILLEGEFMPETIDFSADTDTYTQDGKPMSDAHFTLIEQVGQDGKQKYVSDLTVSDLDIDGDEAKYQLTFSAASPENYKKDRLYILHVRNLDGTRGFTARQGTNPEKLVQKAAQEYMQDFVKAFNADCGEDSRVFNQMKEYLEKDSQAYDDYRGLPGLSYVYNEQIEDASDTDISISDKGDHVNISTTFSYYIVRDRERPSIMDSEKEKSFYNSSDNNKNFSEEEYEGSHYIIYSKDRGSTYLAQERSDSSTFKVFEHLTEKNTFKLRIQDNKTIGPIYKHENDTSYVSRVDGMEYQEDSNKTVYQESDLYGEDDDGGYDDGDEEDYDDYDDDYDDYDDESVY